MRFLMPRYGVNNNEMKFDYLLSLAMFCIRVSGKKLCYIKIMFFCYKNFMKKFMMIKYILYCLPGVTILLSLTVFLNIVTENIPETSEAVPLICGLSFLTVW